MSSKFGIYKVIEKIDHGAMGDIFLVEDTEKKRFALKTLRACIDNSADSESKIRFIREITLSEKIDHPNIVRNYFHDLENDPAYMVMEYLEQGSLESKISEEKILEPDEVLKIALDISKALAECKVHDITHRDVKPANILISEDGTYKLADLGLARMNSALGVGDENLTMSKTALGTPYYISPEQAVDAKKADIRSDIYSLGATLYYALTGKRVHEGSNSVHVMMKHVNNKIAHPSEIKEGLPANLTSVIMKMLEKDINKRYQSPMSLLKDLEKIDQFDAAPEDLLASGMSLNKSKSSNKTGMLMFSFLTGLILITCAAIFRFSCLPPSQGDKAYLKARAELKSPKMENSQVFLAARIKKLAGFLEDYPTAIDAEQIKKALEVGKLISTKKVFNVTLKKVGNLKEARAFSFRLFVGDEKFEFRTDEKKKILFPEARFKVKWNIESVIRMEFEEFEWLDDLIYSAKIPSAFSIRALSGDKVYLVNPAFSEFFEKGEFHVQYELDEISEESWFEFEKYFFPGNFW